MVIKMAAIVAWIFSDMVDPIELCEVIINWHGFVLIGVDVGQQCLIKRLKDGLIGFLVDDYP
jgi:hypothetical protein